MWWLRYQPDQTAGLEVENEDDDAQKESSVTGSSVVRKKGPTNESSRKVNWCCVVISKFIES